jgi:hypothetical protein
MTEISERFQGILYFWINFQSSIFKTEASAIDCLASIYEICEGHERRAAIADFDGPFVNAMLAGPSISTWFKEIAPRQVAVKEKDLLKYMALLEKTNLDIDQVKEDVKSDEKMVAFVESVKKEMEVLKATKKNIDEYKKVIRPASDEQAVGRESTVLSTMSSAVVNNVDNNVSLDNESLSSDFNSEHINSNTDQSCDSSDIDSTDDYTNLTIAVDKVVDDAVTSVTVV